MERGSLSSKFTDRTNPMDKHVAVRMALPAASCRRPRALARSAGAAQTMMELREFTPAPPAPQMFGNAGREHMEKYGAWDAHARALRLSCYWGPTSSLPRARGGCRHDRGADRKDCREESQALHEQPVLSG